MAPTECVGIIAYKKDSVLLVRHTEYARLPTGSYGFPAGRVEENETLIITAMRELSEETGLITSVKYLYLQTPRESRIKMKEGYENFIFHPIICTFYSGELRESEKTVPEWKKIDSLDGLLLVSEDIPEMARKFHRKNF